MPCSVSREELMYHERDENARIYGLHVLDHEIDRLVADEIRVILGTNGLTASATVLRWLERHTK